MESKNSNVRCVIGAKDEGERHYIRYRAMFSVAEEDRGSSLEHCR